MSVHRSLQSDKHLSSCKTCGQMLPLRMPLAAEKPIAWICVSCGTRYEAVLDASCSLEHLQLVRPERIEFDKSDLIHPPEVVSELIARMFPEEEYEAHEKRHNKRRNIGIPIVAVSLDHGFRPTEDVRLVITRNISQTGIALMSTRATRTPYLAIELPTSPDKPTQMVMRPLRCRPLLCFYEIGGPFVTKVQA